MQPPQGLQRRLRPRLWPPRGTARGFAVGTPAARPPPDCEADPTAPAYVSGPPPSNARVRRMRTAAARPPVLMRRPRALAPLRRRTRHEGVAAPAPHPPALAVSPRAPPPYRGRARPWTAAPGPATGVEPNPPTRPRTSLRACAMPASRSPCNRPRQFGHGSRPAFAAGSPVARSPGTTSRFSAHSACGLRLAPGAWTTSGTAVEDRPFAPVSCPDVE